MKSQTAWNLGLVLFCAGLLWSPPASAVKYMSLKQAVHSLLPKDAKIFKTTKTLTAEQKTVLAKDYGWTPSADQVKIYLGKDAAGKVLGHVFIFSASASDWYHKFAVGVRPDGSVIALRVMELTCDWAFPIRREQFLKQFENKRHSDPLTIYADIDGISRATVSSELAAQTVRKAVSLHQLLIAGGKAASASDKVRKARARGAARVEQANTHGT